MTSTPAPPPPPKPAPVIPMAEQTQTSSTQVVHDPAAVKKIEKAQADMQTAVKDGAEIGAQKAAEMNTIRVQTAANVKEMERKNANEQLVEDNRLEMMQLDERRMMDEAAATKKDSKRLYKRMGTAGAVAAWVGVALNAFGAALTGGPNVAYNTLMKAIDGDLDEQEREIQIKKDRVNVQGNLIARFERQIGNKANARSLARQTYLQNAALDLERAAATKPAEVQQAAKEKALQLRTEAAKEEDERKKRNVTFVKSQTPMLTGGSAGAQLPANQAENLGTATAAVNANADLYKSWGKDGKGAWAWLTSFLPATDSTLYEDKRQMAKQVIGTYIEGGMLRKEDEWKYERYLPAVGDSPARALNKKLSLEKLIGDRQKSQKDAMKGAGFNVSNIPDATVKFTPTPTE